MRIFYAGIEDTVHKAGRSRVRWQDACNLMFEKEFIARSVRSDRKGAVKSVGHFVRRIIVRIHCNRKIDKLVVRFVFNREPNGLNVISSKIFSEAASTLLSSERTRTHFYPEHRFLLCPCHKSSVATLVRIELE